MNMLIIMIPEPIVVIMFDYIVDFNIEMFQEGFSIHRLLLLLLFVFSNIVYLKEEHADFTKKYF